MTAAGDRIGRVVWFTGLSGSGKTTLCQQLKRSLEAFGSKVVVLDGDDCRKGFCSDLGFSHKDRMENVRRIAHVSALLQQQGFYVLVATISPTEEIRAVPRRIVSRLLEIFVDTPLHTCEMRDAKGLYAAARKGQMQGVSGVDAAYEAPLHAHLVCRTEHESTQSSVRKIVACLGL